MNDKEIVCLIDERVASKLEKRVFFWAVGILVLVLAGIVGTISSLLATQQQNYNEITNRLTRIETNIEYIQKDLGNINTTLNNYEIIDETPTQTKKGY